MEIEPLEVILAYCEEGLRSEQIYVKNADVMNNIMHVEFKLYDKKRVKVSPAQFSLRPQEIKEVTIEALPSYNSSSSLPLEDFLLVTANEGEFQQRIPVRIGQIKHNEPRRSKQTLDEGYPQSFSFQSPTRSNSHQYALAGTAYSQNERSLQETIEEKNRLIARLEERVLRSEQYCNEISEVLRGKAGTREFQSLLNSFRERSEKEAERREAEFEGEIRRREIETGQKLFQVQTVMQQQESEIRQGEDAIRALQERLDEAYRDYELLQRDNRRIEQQNNRQVEEEKEIYEDQNSEKRLEVKFERYRSEIESLRTALFTEKQKSSSQLLRIDMQVGENQALQKAIEAAELRAENSATNVREISNTMINQRTAQIVSERQRIVELEQQVEKLSSARRSNEEAANKHSENYRKLYEEIQGKYSHLQQLMERSEREKLSYLKETKSSINTTVQPVQLSQIEQGFRAQLQTLEGEIERLDKELSKKSTEVEELRKENSRVHAKLGGVQKNLDEVKQTLSNEQRSQKDTMNTRVALIEKIKDKFEDSLKSKELQVADELARFQIKFENVNTEISRKNREIAVLSAKLDEKEKELKTIKDAEKSTKKKPTKSPAEEKNALNLQIKQLTSEIEQKVDVIEDLNRQLLLQQGTIDEASIAQKKKMQQLEKRLIEAESQRNELMAAKDSTSQVTQTTQNKDGQVYQESDLLVKAIRLENKELEKKYFEEVENAKTAQIAFKAKECDLMQSIQHLTRRQNINATPTNCECKVIKERVINQQEEVFQLKESKDQINKERKGLLEELDRLHDQNDQKQAEIDLLKEDVEKLNRRCERAKAHRESFGNELQGVKSFVVQIEEEKEKIAAQMKFKDTAIVHHTSQREQLEGLLKEIQGEYAELERSSKEEMTSLRSEVEKLNQELDQTSFSNTRMNTKHSDLVKDLAAQISDNKKLKQQIQFSEIKLQQQQAQLDSYEKSKMKQINMLKTQLNEHRQQIQTITQEKNFAIKELEQVHKDLARGSSIYTQHLLLMKTKQAQDLSDFISAATAKISFFISKKDQLDISTKFSKMVENFLDNSTAVAERDSRLKQQQSKIIRLKLKLQAPEKPLPRNKYSISEIAENARVIVNSADFEKIAYETEQLHQASEKQKAEIISLNKEVLTKDEKNKSLNQVIKQQREQLGSEKERADKIVAEKVELQKRITVLEGQLKAKNIIINQKTKEVEEIERLKDRIEIILSDNQKKEELLVKLNTLTTSQKEQIGKLSKQIAETERKDDYVKEMNEKMNAYKEEAALLTTEKSAMLIQISSLKNDVIRKELQLKDRAKLEEKLFEMKQQNDKLKEQSLKNKENIKKLNATIKLKESRTRKPDSQGSLDRDYSEDISAISPTQLFNQQSAGQARQLIRPDTQDLYDD